MKVAVFLEADLLIEYLGSKPGSGSILDFTGNLALKKVKSNFTLKDYNFSLQEKEDILKEYVEAIATSALINKYSIYWLCHPISEKNDLVTDNLFSQIVDYLLFYRAYSDCKNDVVLILTDKISLARNIALFCNNNGIKFSVRGKIKSDVSKNVYGQFLGIFKKIRDFYGRFFQIQRFRKLLKKIDKHKQYSVIRTWFDHRSVPCVNNNKDVYFGILPEILKKQGRDVLYFGTAIDGNIDRAFRRDYKLEDLKNPVVLDRSLLGLFDYVKAKCFKFISGYKIKFPEKISILGIDVKLIFKGYTILEFKKSHIEENFLSYVAIRRFLSIIKIREFFNLFENYANEKLAILAIKKHDSKIKIVGFQHAQISPGSTKFFLGKGEYKNALLPDRIVTLGEVTRDFLLKKKNYLFRILVTGCALRHDHKELSGERKRDQRTILFLLWTLERSVEMLNFLYKSNICSEKYKVIVCPHPNHPFEKLQPYLDFKYNGSFQICDEPLTKVLRSSGIAVYSGTTTSLDALVYGLPVINVEFNDFMSPDPLFSFNDFRWSVKRPEALIPAIKSINDICEEEYFLRQQKGYDFTRKYFYAVNDNNLKPFLK